MDEGARRVEVRTAMTWRSVGEIVTASVEPDSYGGSCVRIVSVPSRHLTAADWGKNAANVETVAEVMGLPRIDRRPPR